MRDPKLKTRIRKGIPGEFRAEVWAHVTGSRKARLENPGEYEFLSNRQSPTAYEEQIWKDIRRTYRAHSVYKNLNSPAQTALYKVLSCYVRYHPSVGYNQGISFVAAFLLLYLEEVDVFWTLHMLTVSPKYAMDGVWAENMPSIHLRFFQMNHLVHEFFPRLSRVLDGQDISPEMYEATQWFVTVFLATDLPFGVILRIWDIYLHEGLKLIFRVGLALVQKLDQQMKHVSGEMIWDVLQAFTTEIDEGLIDSALSISLKSSKLVALEVTYAKNIQEIAE